jgi:activator of HSP90 ATPase
MRTVISQSVVLPAPAEDLFEMYIDSEKHAAITGAPVTIGVVPGSPFQAFNGALTGAILQIIPQRLVVQSWRSVKFNEGDPDSTLILTFAPEATDGRNGRIDLIHLDVPAHDYQGVVEGWETHYWRPWRGYLTA